MVYPQVLKKQECGANIYPAVNSAQSTKLGGAAVSRLDQSRLITMPWQCGFGVSDVVASVQKKKSKIHLNSIKFAPLFIFLFIHLFIY